MKPKDYFSGHSHLYAAYRPAYPDTLYEFIFQHLKSHDAAWDCATGNGQVAGRLARYFHRVYATDISPQQLAHAYQAQNIDYSVCEAGSTSFQDNQFDLVTVGQALHWFKLEDFYGEVRRVAKHGALLAVWGYERCSVNNQIDPLFLEYYHNIVGPYWDAARKLVEDQYQSIPFPFKKIDTPQFHIGVEWTRDSYTHYLSTWSATQKFIQLNGYNPVDTFSDRLKPFWNDDEVKQVTFPVFMKLGEVLKGREYI